METKIQDNNLMKNNNHEGCRAEIIRVITKSDYLGYLESQQTFTPSN